MKPKSVKIAAVALFLLGSAQMVGHLLNVPALRAVANATGASPAPKVFSAVAGLETYTSKFYVEWTDTGGEFHSMQLTPEIYAGIRGPYNRRNVYGAAMAYGPVLAENEHTKVMFHQICHYAFCGDAPLLKELGVQRSSILGPVRVRIEPKDPSLLDPGLKLEFDFDCRTIPDLGGEK